MEVEHAITIRLDRSKSHSKKAVHKIERFSIDLKSSVVRIGIKKLVNDLPGSRIMVVVNDQTEGTHVGDINVCIVAGTTNVNDRCNKERGVFILRFWKGVATQ